MGWRFTACRVYEISCAAVRKGQKVKEKGERYALMSCWYQVFPSDFLPIWSILNHLAVALLNLSQVEESHKAI